MTDDRNQLHDSLSRRLADAGSEPVWPALCGAGVVGLRVPAELGGLGLPVLHAEPVFDVIGEHRASVPYVDVAIVAAGLLQAERSDAGDALLRSIAEGGDRVAVAGLDRRLRGTISATPTAQGWRLDGDALLVMDDGDAGLLLVVARTEAYATVLMLVRRDAEGVTGRTYPTIDGRHASDLRFINVAAELLCGDVEEALAVATDEAIACTAVEAAALMRRLVADTLAFAKEREQFGQPIARFQIVQHRLVDMHIHARRAGAIARRALGALDSHWRERSRLVSAAKVAIVEAGRFVGQNAVQLHGGMGMTEELSVGRYFKRLTVIENELGGADDHLRRYAELVAA